MVFSFIEEEFFAGDYDAAYNGIRTELRKRCRDEKGTVYFCGFGVLEFIGYEAVCDLRKHGFGNIETVGIVSELTFREHKASLEHMDRIETIEIPKLKLGSRMLPCSSDDFGPRKHWALMRSDVVFALFSDRESRIYKTYIRLWEMAKKYEVINFYDGTRPPPDDTPYPDSFPVSEERDPKP